MEEIVKFLKEAETYYSGNGRRRPAESASVWHGTYF